MTFETGSKAMPISAPVDAVPHISYRRIEGGVPDEGHAEQFGHKVQADLRQDPIISGDVEMKPLMDSGFARRHCGHMIRSAATCAGVLG